MRSTEDRRAALMCKRSHQDPSSSILDVLELLKNLPYKKSDLVFQPEGDEVRNEFLCIRWSKSEAGLGRKKDVCRCYYLVVECQVMFWSPIHGGDMSPGQDCI